MRKTLTFLLIALCFTAAAQTSAPQSKIYITHVTVIDTDTGKEATDQTVVISNGEISDVAKSKNLTVQASARIVDGRGKYLIPGLWDMHAHRTEYESTYPMYLVNGVTGVREMAGPFDANKFRSDLGAKKLDAPHFFFASRIVDGTPPRVSDQIVVKNAEEARKVVQEQKRAGADFIKVMDRLSRDAYFAIIEEAKRQGIPVVGHVPFAISAWEASASGQKSIEHVHAVPLACSTHEAELRARLVATQENSWKLWNPIYIEAYESYSDEKCQRLFAEFRKHGTWSVPTLVVFRSTAMSSDPQFRNDDRLRYFGGEMRTWLSKNAVMERKNFEPSDFAVERELLNRRKWLVGKLFRAGVPMLAGTDTPNPFCFPGFGLHDELALMVDSGVTPLGALQAATRNPAIFLDAKDKYGSVSPGKVADLVLLDADPLTDIHNTTKIREVFLDGKEFDRSALDQLLKNAQTATAIPPSDAASGRQSSDAIKMSDVERAVWEKEGANWRFVQAKDRDAYVGLWDDRFVGWPRLEPMTIHKDGSFGSLEGRKLLDYKLEPLSVRESGDSVVITFYPATISRLTPNGEVDTSTSRLTHTWMKTDQGWRIIGGMSTDDKQATDPLHHANSGENASENDAMQSLVATDEARRVAMLRGDITSLASLLADDAVILWGDGTVDDKSSTLGLFRSGQLRYTRLDYNNTSVRIYGDVAVITGDARLEGRTDERSFQQNAHVTRVYTRKQDQWRLVLNQTTRAAPIGNPADALAQGNSYNSSTDSPQPPFENGFGVTFVPARQLLSEIRKAPEQRPSISWVDYLDKPTYSATVIRRTAPDRSEVHKAQTEIQYVIEGKGTLLTGGSLIEGVESEPNELRGSGISKGDEHHVATGDLLVIPAGVPHWVRAIDGKEIVYLSVKSRSTDPPSSWKKMGFSKPTEESMKTTEPSSAEAELRAFMAELRKASIDGDVETIANSMADDYVQTDINGYRQDKTTWFNEYFKPLADLIKAGKFHWDEYERNNLQFRFYGDCAVVTGELQAKGTGARFGPHHTWVADPSASFSGTLHFTHVYLKRNGKWMLAALHNQIPLPPAKATN